MRWVYLLRQCLRIQRLIEQCFLAYQICAWPAMAAPLGSVMRTSIRIGWCFLGQRDPAKPFFGFWFYDSVHGYSYPDPHRGPYSNLWQPIDRTQLNATFDPESYANRHGNAVHFVDGLVQRVVEDLKRRDLIHATLILVTSDHGEEFNDNKLNFWGRGSNYARAQLYVPFFLLWPGRSKQVFADRSGHMDIASTLLTELLACENPSCAL